MRFPIVFVLTLASCARTPDLAEPERLGLGRALIEASLAGDDDRALELIGRGAGIDVRWGDAAASALKVGSENWTPLHAACLRGRARIVRALLAAKADPSLDDGYGATPLDFALDSESPEAESVSLLLIEAGAPVNTRIGIYIDDYGSGGRTALHTAAWSGFHGAARALLARGAKVHAKTSYGRSPLHGASDLDMIRLLVEQGGDLDALDRFGESPLAVSISHDQPERALLFIRAGADVNAGCRRGTVLTEAVDRAWPRVVDALLERGAKPEAWNEDQRTALQIASQLSLPAGEEMGLSLLRRGAQAELGEEPDENPVHGAVRSGHRRLLQALLAKGASVRIGGKTATTPLHQACTYPGDEEIVRMLLEAGADPAAKDVDGKIPADYLDDRARPRIEPLLRKKP